MKVAGVPDMKVAKTHKNISGSSHVGGQGLVLGMKPQHDLTPEQQNVMEGGF